MNTHAQSRGITAGLMNGPWGGGGGDRTCNYPHLPPAAQELQSKWLGWVRVCWKPTAVWSRGPSGEPHLMPASVLA